MEQVALFVTSDAFDPFAFDKVVIGFSGGKDSVACVLHCLELGIHKDRIELWHHEIDDGDTGQLKMDWPCTHGYVKAFANALGIPLYFSWREGGFARELLRENALTAPTLFETPDGLMKAGGVRGTPSTRRKFPQQSANLSTRWCSAALKIDICSIAIANQARFNGKRTILVTGERAQESSARAKYQSAEPHKPSNRKRMVWQWRPVHQWSEEEVWTILERHRIRAHPAYFLGWSKCSCMTCIFGSPSQWASVAQIAPRKVIQIRQHEKDFGVTLRRDGDIDKAIGRGVPYPMDSEHIRVAMSETYDLPIFMDKWVLPSGAYGEAAGPT